MNLYTSVNNVLKRLDDYPSLSGEQVWTRDEVELYLKDGYNAFCRQTKCLLDFFYPENVALAGNYVAKWERTYFESGMIAVGLLGFSGGYWERDYALASATGPANLTQPWEAEYLATTFPAALHPVPEDNVTVDRATHDLHQLDPEFTRFFEERARDFQTTSGEPWRFAMDRDGIGGFRTVPAASGNATINDVRLFSNIVTHWTLGEASGDRLDLAGTHFDSYGPLTLEDKTGIGVTTGLMGSAALFVKASSDYMESPSTRFDGNGGFSVTFWVKPTTFSNFQHVVSLADSLEQCLAIWSGSAGQLTASVNETGAIYEEASISGALNSTVWTLCCLRWSPSDGYVKLWSMNSLSGPNTDSSPGTLSAVAVIQQPFVIGRVSTTVPTHYFDGALQDVTVWSVALTDADLTWLYNSGAGRAFPYQYDGTFRDSTHRHAGNYGFGLMRSAASEFGTWAPAGTWGVLREIPEHFPMGAQFGIPRRLYSDTANTRVEYFRQGKSPSENAFELPERFMRYVEFFAQAKCLERDGPGQDLKLAGHFMERFGSGVRRMVLRLGENKRAVSGKIGSAGRIPTKPALARLPWRYGRQIRRGY